MDERLRPLFDRAFDRAPGREANAAIDRARQAMGTTAKVRSYELIVPAGATLEWFTGEVLPKLIYHLESLGARPPAPGVFLTAFVGEEVLFVRIRDVVDFAQGVLGFGAEEMLRRWGTGEARGPVLRLEPQAKKQEGPEKRPVLALPPDPEPQKK